MLPSGSGDSAFTQRGAKPRVLHMDVGLQTALGVQSFLPKFYPPKGAANSDPEWGPIDFSYTIYIDNLCYLFDRNIVHSIFYPTVCNVVCNAVCNVVCNALGTITNSIIRCSAFCFHKLTKGD